MRSGRQVCLQRNGGHIEGNENYPRTLEIGIDYVLFLNIKIKTSFFYDYLLLDCFEYVYLKFNSELYLLAQAGF